MIWFRIDNRLIHGQIIEAWLPYLDAERLVVVNDDLYKDEVRQEIMRLAIPERIAAAFLPMSEAAERYSAVVAEKVSALFLVSDCRDAERLMRQGIPIALLNVGNMHYSAGKKQICSHVAASESDVRCFRELEKMGVKLDFRCVPSEIPMIEDW